MIFSANGAAHQAGSVVGVDMTLIGRLERAFSPRSLRGRFPVAMPQAAMGSAIGAGDGSLVEQDATDCSTESMNEILLCGREVPKRFFRVEDSNITLQGKAPAPQGQSPVPIPAKTTVPVRIRRNSSFDKQQPPPTVWPVRKLTTIMKLKQLLVLPAAALFLNSCSPREVTTEKETVEKETTVLVPAPAERETVVVPGPVERETIILPAPEPAPVERETIVIPVPVPTPEADPE